MIVFTFGCSSVDRDRSHEPVAEVVIYTSMYDYIIEPMWRQLQESFPQYGIHFVYGGTGVIQERIKIEEAGGRLGADILMVAEPAYSFELKDKGMLHPFIFKEASNLAFDYDPEGYWYPVRVSNMVLAFNPERNSRNSIANSFYGFANDSSVRNAIAMRNPIVSGTTFASVSALSDKYGDAYFTALGNQRVMIDYGSDGSLLKLESGESKLIMVLEESILRARKENNSKIEIIYPSDGTIVIPSTIMVINNKWNASRNTEAAVNVANWFLSRDGQEAIVDAWMHSVRKDFTKPPQGSVPLSQIVSTSLPVNWQNVYRNRQDIVTKFETNVAGR